MDYYIEFDYARSKLIAYLVIFVRIGGSDTRRQLSIETAHLGKW